MDWTTFTPALLASIVEFVEALTIILVIGVTVNWKSSLTGALAAFFTLVIIVVVFGRALISFDINILRIIVGIILILFGFMWLKKAVLRYTGLKAKHDEAKIFEKQKAKIDKGNQHDLHFNTFGFLTSYKSVLLEGLEVVVIVLFMGVTSNAGKMEGLWSASIAALCAFIIVGLLGLAVRKPLTLIPENTLKYIVGIMLASFGIFWSGEALGFNWPGADLSILMLIGINFVFTLLMMLWMKNFSHVKEQKERHFHNFILKVLKELFDFFCGDWYVFFGYAITLIMILIVRPYATSIILIPLYILGIFISFILSLRTDVAKA